MERLSGYLHRLEQFLPGADEFEHGFYTALILVGAVILLLLVLYCIYRLQRRAAGLDGVTLKRDDGDVFVAKAALTQAVRNLEPTFPGMDIQKVILRRKHGADLELAVTLIYDARNGSFDTLTKNLKERIFKDLGEIFGIDTVKSVALRLLKLPERSAPKFSHENHDAVPPVSGF